MNLAARMTQAVASLQGGQLDQTMAICEDVLRIAPGHAQALHLLGVTAIQRGATAAAAAYFREALLSAADDPALECNLGNCLRDLHEYTEALRHYQAAIRLAPDFAGAHYGEGNALLDLGRAQEAILSFNRALKIDPTGADAWLNRGNACRQTGDLDAALGSYLRALAIKPESDAALHNSADVLMALGRYTDALRCIEARIVLRPQAADAYRDHGYCLLRAGRATDAAASYSTALAKRAEDAEALYGRGLAWQKLRRHTAALADFERALQLRPDNVDVLFRSAESLRDVRRLAEAAARFQEVVALQPDRPYALGNMLHTRLQLCDWTDYASTVKRVVDAVAAGQPACAPGAFLAVAPTPHAQLRCARTFWRDRPVPPQPDTPAATMQRRRRLRVAYVSADFREHPVAMLLVGVIECHDREQFEIIGVSLSPPQESALGKRMVAAFDRFVDVSALGDADIEAVMRELDADICVDLMGFSAGARPELYARRVAAVQVGFLGYAGTMGSSHFDYLIADSTVVTPAEFDCYSERLVNLQPCYLPADDKREMPTRWPTRSDCGLPEDAFVYCCFNGHYKINPEVFGIWMELLLAVPGSVLWLADGHREAVANLQREAANRGVSPARLHFAPRVPEAVDHLARYALADLFLDTQPFGAHATASDVLWAGLPLLTVRGPTFASRVAASLLSSCELHELIAADLASYANVAVEFARSPHALRDLRARLARNRFATQAFDTAGYCRKLERAFASMSSPETGTARPNH